MYLTKFDNLFSSLIMGIITFLTFFLMFWWVSYLFFQNHMKVLIVLGIICGMISEIFLLKRLSAAFYRNLVLSTSVYLLYMLGIFGFFMGVPIFNIIPGVFAGIYIGRKAKMLGLNNEAFKKKLSRANFIVSGFLSFFMIGSSIIALRDKYTAQNLKGMMHLSHEINKSEIFGIIFIGGFFLLALQYMLVIIFGNIAYRK